MRRIFAAEIVQGRVSLGEAEAHHLRDVLRGRAGDTVEVFDGKGRFGRGTIVRVDAGGVDVDVERVEIEEMKGVRLTVMSAVPKGNRADWMVEKLAEIGVALFVPIVSQRSVVEPKGTVKLDRWRRIAAEAARQSGQSALMAVDEVARVDAVIRNGDWYLSLEEGSRQVGEVLAGVGSGGEVRLIVGPEGGWTEGEMKQFKELGLIAVKLTGTVLRVETAAVVGAGVVMTFAETRNPKSE